jgi:hypothetical protein
MHRNDHGSPSRVAQLQVATSLAERSNPSRARAFATSSPETTGRDFGTASYDARRKFTSIGRITAACTSSGRSSSSKRSSRASCKLASASGRHLHRATQFYHIPHAAPHGAWAKDQRAGFRLRARAAPGRVMRARTRQPRRPVRSLSRDRSRSRSGCPGRCRGSKTAFPRRAASARAPP